MTDLAKDRIKFNDGNLNPSNCHSLCAFIYKQDFAELLFLRNTSLLLKP